MLNSQARTIPFNVPYDSTPAFNAIMAGSFDAGRTFAGKYSEKVRKYFFERYGSEEVILTSACTRALELTALLLDLKPGDEVIVPSYTYVSSANAFDLYGATVRFCESGSDSPNMDLAHLETLISPRTKAVVVVHYAGVSVNMYQLLHLVAKHKLILIEDAAQAIDAFYDGRLLGTFGDLATFSFHETKNVSCGQGGVLLVNNKKFAERARILRDCGTNRDRFLLGLEDKYTWVDTGSVFNLPELCCAYLYPQLMDIKAITARRKALWANYYNQLLPLREQGRLELPEFAEVNEHNAHIFYLILPSGEMRDDLSNYLRRVGVVAPFHYTALHQSPYYRAKYGGEEPLPNAEKFATRLLRLPLYYDLTFAEQAYIVECMGHFFGLTQPAATLPGQFTVRLGSNLLAFPLTDLVESSGLLLNMFA